MKRLLQLDVLLIAAVLVIAGVIAVLSQTDQDAGYPTIAEHLEPLRSAFNADPGDVRAILLASPT
ncbi:MAG: hypothetical protein ACE5GX_01960 [Thermoanaerobaculia bacterium]